MPYEGTLKMFEIALKKMWWPPERGQAYIWMGLAHRYRKEYPKAIEMFHKSLVECSTRREPFWELGQVYEEMGDLDNAVLYFESALKVPYKAHGYLNNMQLYGWLIPDKLAQIYAKMGKKEESKKHWLACLKLKPDKRILNNLPYYYGYELPLVSIVVPTCRPEGFARLEKSIREFTVYPNYEIIKKDGEGTAVEKFNQGVEESRGDFIVFLADDCEVELGWLEQAFVCFKERFRDRGLVIFNDHHWNGTMANHFFCSRNIREELDGEIWASAYKHCSVDIELYCRLKAKNLIEYCPEACILHHHHYCTSEGTTADKKDKWHELVDSWAFEDRKLLPIRLWNLGLRSDAHLYASWFLAYKNYPKVPPTIDLRARMMEMDVLCQDIKVLNIGIGEGDSGLARQLPYFYFKELTHVEVHKPYIEMDKKRRYNTPKVKHIHKDVYKFDDYKGYDIIFAFDVLEHLPKEQSLKVIDRMKKSGARILIFGPLEEEPRENRFNVESQDHLSFWTEQDFKDLGFKTAVLKKFHKDGDKRWDAVWATL